MSDYNSFDPFSVCFNILKIKYKDYDESLSEKKFLEPNDKINVFINLETAFKHLSMITDLEKKLILQRDFDIILTSNILNLAAHYKRFFVSNGLDTKVYIYHTDFDSTGFEQYKYNEDFRTYYLVKYNDNPKFSYLTNALKKYILPEVRTYCEFIPNVYYISSKNIDSSLVPFIISSSDKSRKNFIIGGDYYETQYSFFPNFMNHFIHKGIGVNTITSNCFSYLKEITKKDNEEIKSLMNVYNSYGMYCSLLSVLGDRIRSIDGISGIGPKILKNYIESGLNRNEIQLTTHTPEMIGKIFHDDDIAEEFINNYYCTNVLTMSQELTDGDILSILNQQADRLDLNSLIQLNKTRFANYPLILESLTM